jgi:DNA mismatch repair protein MutS
MAVAPVIARGSDEVEVGLAWIDVAAGRFEAAVVPRADVADHLQRLEPAECLCAEKHRELVGELVRGAGRSCVVTARPDWWFDETPAAAALGRALGGRRVEGLGFELPDDRPALAAAGAVVSYLEENEPTAVGRIVALAAWRPGHRLEIDEASRRSLELVRSTATGRRVAGGYDLRIELPLQPFGRQAESPVPDFALAGVLHDVDELRGPEAEILWRGSPAIRERNAGYATFFWGE